jgi:hypothetical protein
VPFRLDPFREPLHNAVHQALVCHVAFPLFTTFTQLEIVFGLWDTGLSQQANDGQGRVDYSNARQYRIHKSKVAMKRD